MKRVAAKLAFLLLALACAAVCSVPANAVLPAMTSAQYSVALQRIEAAVDTDRKSGTTTAPDAVKPVLQCLVRTDTPPTNVFVDNRPLLADIDSAESAKPALRAAQLTAVKQRIDDLTASMSSQSPTVGQAAKGEQVGRETLLSPRFSSDPIPPDSQLDKLGKRISDWWAALMKRLKFKGPSIGDPHIDPKIPLAILIVILVGAVGILIWYLVGFLRSRSIMPRKAKLETSLALDEEEAELVAARAFDKLLDLASQRAAANDYRSAFRLVFVASLVALDTDGVVRLNRSSTNWEYLRTLRATNPAYYDILLPMTRNFDRIWYGFRSASTADYEGALARYDDLRRTAKAPVAGSAIVVRT